MRIDVRNTDVVILCGGLGTRMKEIAKDIPKPMLQIRGYPFLSLVVDYMFSYGFGRFVLCVGHKWKVIERYYEGDKRKRLKVSLACEDKPLDTGGAIKEAARHINGTQFLVLNGDSFCRFNPCELLRFHQDKKAIISMVLIENPSVKDYGQVEIDKFSRIRSFNEKDVKTKSYLINAGVYVFDKGVFDLMPEKRKFSLERDFFPKMVSGGFYGFVKSGNFVDIGTPQKYKKTKELFSDSGLFKKVFRR
jgi:NDP-sugar pyrophosphorylase family protein